MRNVERWQDISLPVDEFRPRAVDLNKINTAINTYTRQCAARYGVNFEASTSTVLPRGQNRDYYRLFGLVDAEAAGVLGYHVGERLAANGEGAKPPASNISGVGSEAVLTGDPSGAIVAGRAVPPGGCINEARQSIGNPDLIENRLEEAINYGLTHADDDPRVVEGFSKWSACMRASKFNYSTPMAANNDSGWASPTASTEEIATAEADVRCKAQTGLTSLRVAVTSAWITSYIADHSQTFASARKASVDQLSEATSFLKAASE